MNDTVRHGLYLSVMVALMILLWWWLLPEGPSAEPGWTVERVVDGDTIEVSDRGVNATVRLIGIDAPERDTCGYDEARDYLAAAVLGEDVTLIAGAPTDEDGHGRALRYVEYRGIDVGLAMIAEGHAVARYDSRTDQPHPREDLYREADAGTPAFCDGQ